MPIEPAVAELLRAVGYIAASHVMARATLSSGTGRYEEQLTADVADMLTLFNPYGEFLRVRGSRSRFAVRVIDFHKAAEAKIGADFAVLLRGTFGSPRKTVGKAVLVQAKRQQWGKAQYAQSTNHVAKATTMKKTVGLANSFFAFYHSDSVCPLAPSTLQPQVNFLYASPLRGNQHFFSGGQLSPRVPEGFLEQSAYRRHLLGAARSLQLPSGFEWGIGIVDAGHFIGPTGTVLNTALPPIKTVLSQGRCLGDFFVDLAECRAGTPRTDAELRALLGTLQNGVLGDGEGAFAPSFALALSFASNGDDDAGEDDDDSFWLEVPDVRRLETQQ